MSLRVALVSQSGTENFALTQLLECDARFQVKRFSRLQDLSLEFIDFKCQALVLPVSELRDEHVVLVEKIRRYFPEVSILFVAELFQDEMRFRLRRFHQVAAIQLKLELQDLPQLLLRHFQSPHLPARLHPRSRRQDRVEVFTGANDVSSITGNFQDFAKMGAKLLLPSGILKINMQITVRYVSSTQQKHQNLIAKVVWEGEPGGWFQAHRGRQLYGIKFIAIA